MEKALHVGFDDTDSIKGSCTTHIATIIVNKIFNQVNFIDFPNLIRLNPNIPYKTRGNGAIALRISGEKLDITNCQEIIIQTIEKHARFEDRNTNPGIVFIQGEIPQNVKLFSLRAMWDILSIEEAENFEKRPNISMIKYGNGRGIIGAVGALGNMLENDFTYEHLTYRMPEKYGSIREIDRNSIIVADKATPLTFNNIDYDYDTVMILPKGADPVFAGIRGETIEEVVKAWDLIIPLEKIAMQMIFRTNQHTNQHFVKEINIKDLKPYQSTITKGIISREPYYIDGRHLIFEIQDSTSRIDCAAYEPTKRFRGLLKNLKIGDKVIVFGGVRPPTENHPKTINIERLKVESTVELFDFENPFCDNCGARLKSAGKNKGFKCFKCSSVFRDKTPLKKKHERAFSVGDYLPPIIAQRHLTKSEERMHRDNTGHQLHDLKEIMKIMQKLVDYNQNTS